MFQTEAILIDTSLKEKAWSQLFYGLEKRAFRFACLELGDSGQAGDMVQEAAIKLMQKYSDRPTEEWVALFYAILRNHIRDHQRRQRLERLLGFWRTENDDAEEDLSALPDLFPSPDDQLSGQQLGTQIESALRQLPNRQREAFLFREWQELSVEETAMAMGCSSGSVKVHHYRALRRLRTLLADWAPGGYDDEA